MSITLAQAQALLAGVADHAAAHGLRLSAIVLDGRGAEVAAARMDGAGWVTISVARGKATTCVAFGRPSDALAGMRVELPEVFAVAAGQLPVTPVTLAGGLPLPDGLGAIGVSGASAEEDREAAEAAIKAVFG